MDAYQQLITTIALTMGVAWASGINLYATIAMLGILGSTGNIDLPTQLLVVQDPLVIGSAAIMYCVEFFADKTPGLDTGWDAIHSFIRIPAGVMLAAGAVGDVSTPLVVASGILGGTISGVSHSIKAGSRVLINTSPEPFSNWTASVLEDVAVIAGIWTAINYPLLFIGLFILFIILAIWLLPKIMRGIIILLKKIRGFFGATPEPTSQYKQPARANPPKKIKRIGPPDRK
ncbi:DUF4126 domain-containing protein [Desulfotalea psychrophila]|uniref:DUF4126 domain-containing protein n=1 Tax=Desulfotalea psychrophila (strain LSv54 / DSM 12343) TaxID=177439 RepID=Q6AR23_DESPS|nr:DUF4126 domain-containing protein [Desulfotalea psychrophila]CAG35201.1 hypothetical protein DP0472 [Desulfotalea psychrophila LSv54]